MIVLASCSPDNAPKADWCWTYDFRESDEGFNIPVGEWVPTLGLHTVSGDLSFSYEHDRFVEPSFVYVAVQRPVGIEGEIPLSVSGIIYGVSASFAMGYTEDNSEVGSPRGTIGTAGKEINVTLDTSDKEIIISSLTIEGFGATPFPFNPCDPEYQTPTPENFPQPTATLTPTLDATLTPTASSTGTQTPTPTPVPHDLLFYWYVPDSPEDMTNWQPQNYDISPYSVTSFTCSATLRDGRFNLRGCGESRGQQTETSVVTMDVFLNSQYNLDDIGVRFHNSAVTQIKDYKVYVDNNVVVDSNLTSNTSIHNRIIDLSAYSGSKLTIEVTVRDGFLDNYIAGISIKGTTSSTHTATPIGTISSNTAVPTATPTAFMTSTPVITRTPAGYSSPTPLSQTEIAETATIVALSATPVPASSTPRPTLTAIPSATRYMTTTPIPGTPGTPGASGTDIYRENEAEYEILEEIKRANNEAENARGEAGTFFGGAVGWFFDLFSGFFDWLGSLIAGIFSFFATIIGLIIEILSIIILFIQLLLGLVGLLLAWIGQVIGRLTALIQSFFTAPLTPIPVMPLCVSDPLSYEICALYYMADWTIFAPNTPGQFIVPLVLAVMNVIIIFRFARMVLRIISRGEDVTR
mgnify:FL=1